MTMSFSKGTDKPATQTETSLNAEVTFGRENDRGAIDRLRSKNELMELELSHLREQVAQQDDEFGKDAELKIELEQVKLKS